MAPTAVKRSTSMPATQGTETGEAVEEAGMDGMLHDEVHVQPSKRDTYMKLSHIEEIKPKKSLLRLNSSPGDVLLLGELRNSQPSNQHKLSMPGGVTSMDHLTEGVEPMDRFLSVRAPAVRQDTGLDLANAKQSGTNPIASAKKPLLKRSSMASLHSNPSETSGKKKGIFNMLRRKSRKDDYAAVESDGGAAVHFTNNFFHDFTSDQASSSRPFRRDRKLSERKRQESLASSRLAQENGNRHDSFGVGHPTAFGLDMNLDSMEGIINMGALDARSNSLPNALAPPTSRPPQFTSPFDGSTQTTIIAGVLNAGSRQASLQSSDLSSTSLRTSRRGSRGSDVFPEDSVVSFPDYRRPSESHAHFGRRRSRDHYFVMNGTRSGEASTHTQSPPRSPTNVGRNRLNAATRKNSIVEALNVSNGRRESISPLGNQLQLEDDNQAWTAPDSWAILKDDIEGNPDAINDGEEDEGDGANAATIATQNQGQKSAEPKAKGPNYCIRIFRADGTFATISTGLYTTTQELIQLLFRKFFMPESSIYKIYIRERGLERALGLQERPFMIQKRRLEQMGYTDLDKIEDLGRDDNSYLCHFTFRPAFVPDFGHEEEKALGSCRDVDLQAKNLQTIPIFLYQQVDHIRFLNLSRNPMMDLPSDFITLCTCLEGLSMSESCVKKIQTSVGRASSIKSLDLACNRIKDLHETRLNHLINLTEFYIQNNRISQLPPYFASFDTLKVLNISNNKIDVFPEAICHMRSLEYLDISFNTFSSLPDEISALDHLENLILAGNRLTHLPLTMRVMAQLRELDCRRNEIVSLEAIDYLPNLESVKCSYNAITVFDGHFEGMKEIKLWKNPITTFAISGTASTLAHLNLCSAKLSSIPESIFTELSSLKTLDVGHNHLTTLPASICNLTELVKLDITYNSISLLPEELGQMVALQELICHNNNLKHLPETIWLCSHLTVLNLSSNILESFPDPPSASIVAAAKEAANGTSESFSLRDQSDGRKTSVATVGSASGSGRPPLASSLQKLYLADNRLNDDVFTPISLFSELRIVNLSYNDILDASHLSLHRNLALKQLHLSGCQITSLPADEIERLSNLDHLFVNANKLQTLPAELGKIRNLMVLDVGCNALKYNIANWPYDWNWNWNLELRFLNLSGNKRLEIKPGQGAPNTLLKSRNLADFGALKDLRVLGLMDVTLIMSSIPDESADRRIRTSTSEMNGMAYGMADTLGSEQHLSYTDLVIPKFRGIEDECLFGLFSSPSGKAQSQGSHYARYLQENMGPVVTHELARVNGASSESISHALRRCFLSLDKQLAEAVANRAHNDFEEEDHRSGCSALLVYIREKAMYVANCGNSLAVISRNGGNAFLASTHHKPFEPEETARIRAAEGWVSKQGLVNDEHAVSRSFGYFNLVPIMTASPSIQMIALTESDEFVIMASESIWDFMSYQTAVDIARTEKDDLMLAAQKLRDFALSYGAEEKIVVMVIGVGGLFESRQAKARRKAYNKDSSNDADIYSSLTGAKKLGRRGKDLLGDSTLARLEREVPPPVGQIALVFTDIKNSTLLWETNPAMQSAMRIHNGIMRRQLRIIGGYEVKTEGDAFMVSFQTVTSALLWCVTVQLELLKADWPQEIVECDDGREFKDAEGKLIFRGLSVRMGIHYGAPVCESDPITRRMDYFGPMVNRSARVSGTADGGQIMISADVVTELNSATESLDAEVEVAAGPIHSEDTNPPEGLDPAARRDLRLLRQTGYGIVEVGERKLKGLETPERLSLIYPKELLGRLERERAPSATIHVTSELSEGLSLHSIIPNQIRQLVTLSMRLGRLASNDTKKYVREEDVHAMVHRVIAEDVSYTELVALLHIVVVQIESHCAALHLQKVAKVLLEQSADGLSKSSDHDLLVMREILRNSGLL